MNSIPKLVGVFGVLALTAFSTLAQTISLPTLLEEMVDRGAITRTPEPWYTCRQASSYDRASTTPDDAETWFANADVDKYLRVEENVGRQEWVMMDERGPGAIVRIWSANPKGTLRIYLDGSTTPAIEGPMSDLLAGTWKVAGVEIAAPLAKVRSRGCNLYLPVPYAESCKITSDAPGFYYQVNYRTYAEDASVETFTPGSLQRSAVLLARVQQRLASPWLSLAPALATMTIGPGETGAIELPEGPATVRELRVSLDHNQPRDALRWLVLEGDFDGEQTIWCPLGDFFLTGPLLNDVQTWTNLVDAQAGTLRSAWLMPFRDSAVLRIRNLGTEPVTIGLGAAVEERTWDDRSMYFHARWRQESPIPTRPMIDWNYVEAVGEGLYVGDVLSVANPVTTWWGEGDEKIYVDGETFPSHFGTGTEDYYGYAWCCPEVFQGPFHAQPRCDGPGNFGHTTVARVRLLDGIPFRESIRTDMEVWHWAECDIGYAVTTFLYMRPGGTTNRPPQPAEAARGVVDPPPLPPPFTIEGVLECEDLEVIAASDELPVGMQDLGGYARDKWSNNAHLWIQGRAPGDFVELRIPVEGQAPRRLTLFATKSWDYGILRFTVNGEPAGEDLDTFSGGQGIVEPTGPIELGTFTPRDGALVLRVEVVGGHPDSLKTKSLFGLDAVLLEEVEQ